MVWYCSRSSLSTDKVRHILPPMSELSIPLESLLGAVKMTCLPSAKSSLFQKLKSQTDSPSIDWHEISSPYQEISHLTDILSLACDTYVSWTMRWMESEDCRAFGGQDKRLEVYSSVRDEILPRKTAITTAHLKIVRDLLPCWQRMMMANQKLSLAIERWGKSKRPASLQDQLIELRIALEALYLDNVVQGELSFRLATHVAWHLGQNPEE